MRFDLSDKEWAMIEPLLPKDVRGKARVDDRRVMNGIFYILRTGCPWRDLPKNYGNWHSIYTRFKRGSEKGLWWHILVTLQQQGKIMSVRPIGSQMLIAGAAS